MPQPVPPKKWKAPKGPKPVQHKNKNTIGLGRTIANAKKNEQRVEFLPDGEMRFATERQEASWVKLRLVTQENALDEFLSTAEMADTDFSAERGANVKIININTDTNPHLLSAEEEARRRALHLQHENELRVPRRPLWDRNTSRLELDRMEKSAFLEWRRDLAQLQQNNDLLLTPFERNLEVWRQLWRVVERLDLVVQIVDARAPLMFRSVDLEVYVNEVAEQRGEEKRNLLLVNKADLLNELQRQAWGKYFAEKGIRYKFFSAKLAAESLEQEIQLESQQGPQLASELENELEAEPETAEDENANPSARKSVLDASPTAIIGLDDLEELLISEAPDKSPLNVGLVGYPNVGKSSTINALVGSKRVSVSATPGKTKHFQTIPLSPEVTLCDCPGLVFPNFAYTNGELVCCGVLPIDQLREYTGPVDLVAQRIPKFFLEAVYGIAIPTQAIADGGSGITTSAELLTAYARSRGYMTQGFGAADMSRALRYILKDYVNGKLPFVHPPPMGTLPAREDLLDFNRALYTVDALPETRRAQVLEAAKKSGIDVVDLARDIGNLSFSLHVAGSDKLLSNYGGRFAALPSAGDDLDREFFLSRGVQGQMKQAFHKGDAGSGSKKHGKSNKKKKRREGMVGLVA